MTPLLSQLSAEVESHPGGLFLFSASKIPGGRPPFSQHPTSARGLKTGQDTLPHKSGKEAISFIQ